MSVLKAKRVPLIDVLRSARRPDESFDADGLYIADRLRLLHPHESAQNIRWAVDRCLAQGYLDRGVSWRGAWLTEEGIKQLILLEKQAYQSPVNVSRETSGRMLPF